MSCFYIVLLFAAVVVCPLLDISNAVVNTTNTNYSTTVLVTCNSGYAIDSLNAKNNTAITTCTIYGNWSSSSILCSGYKWIPDVTITNGNSFHSLVKRKRMKTECHALNNVESVDRKSLSQSFSVKC